jgi:hypothetical protein
MRKAVIIILCALGLIVGVVVGEQLAGIPGLSWLAIGSPIGFQSPLELTLGTFSLTFGFYCTINVAGVFGLILFAILAKWLVSWLKI